MPSDAKKDKWDKLGVVVSAAIPVTIAILGWLVNANLNRSKAEVQYVQIATEVLQRDSSSPVLRRWAVRILDDLGPIPMSPELREALESGREQLPVSGRISGRQQLEQPSESGH